MSTLVDAPSRPVIASVDHRVALHNVRWSHHERLLAARGDWRRGVIEVNLLRRGSYQRVQRSGLLPQLDLAELPGYLGQPGQTRAVKAYRAALRRARRARA